MVGKDGLFQLYSLTYQLLQIYTHFSLFEFLFALITVLCIDTGLTSEADCIFSLAV